jgi:hypothetical protein
MRTPYVRATWLLPYLCLALSLLALLWGPAAGRPAQAASA